MRTLVLVLAAFLALAHVALGVNTDVNVGDVTYKTAFAATSTDLYRSTTSVFNSWTTISSSWDSLESVGYARVRHCYKGTNLYMVAIRATGALRIVTYSIVDSGSNAGEPEMSSSVDFSAGPMSFDVSGVYCNKGRVFVIKCVWQHRGCGRLETAPMTSPPPPPTGTRILRSCTTTRM